MAEALPLKASAKTLCRYFQQGVCQRGDSCIYSHNWTDKPSTVCVYYQRGSCSYGSHCRYDHVKDSNKGNAKLSTNHKDTTSKSLSKFQGHSEDAVELSPKVPARLISKKGVCQLPVNGLSNIPAASKMVTLGKSSATDPVVKLPSGQLSVEEWVTASEFVPGQQWKGMSLPCSYVNAAKVGVPSVPSDEAAHYSPTPMPISGELCPFYAYGECCYGDQCQYIHGEICEMCQLPVLLPFDIDQQNKHFQECLNQHERDMEESFAVDRSKDKVCGICMETIWEKEPEVARRFGILSGCCHIYCLDCIRKWRGAKQFENKVVRSCPECRVKSDFVTPSKYWVEVKEDKVKLIDEYKQALSKKPCKHFNQGKGECPFNAKCFYLHAYPDGRIASPRPWRRRHRQDADGATSIIGQILLWDFLDDAQESRSQQRGGNRMDESDDWEAFFRRLQLLGIALPGDDDSSSGSTYSGDDSDDEEDFSSPGSGLPSVI